MRCVAVGVFGSVRRTGKRNPARALALDIAVPGRQTCSDDRRVIVAVAMGGGRAGLNADGVRTLPEFRKRLHEVMGYRADKAVFVRAEPGVRWSEFIEMVGQVWPETDVVSLLTGSVAAQANYCGPMLRHDETMV